MSSDTGGRAARLAAWTTAVLQGRCGTRDAVEAIVGGDGLHEVADLPGRFRPVPLADAFEVLAEAGVAGLRYAPAVAGDVSALPGPAAFNVRALAAGGAVVCLGPTPLGLVGAVAQHGPPDDTVLVVTWHASEVSRRLVEPVDLRHASRRLAEVVQESLDQLYRLDVARAHPDAVTLVQGWSGRSPSTALPPGADPAASHLLDRVTHLRQVVALALRDEGATVTGWEAEQRRQTLRDLDRVLLHLEADAWNHGLAARS